MLIRDNITSISELITEINFALLSIRDSGGNNNPANKQDLTTTKTLIKESAKKLHPIGGTSSIGFTARLLKLPEITSSLAVKNSLFVDVTDGVLKFKDSSDVINILY